MRRKPLFLLRSGGISCNLQKCHATLSPESHLQKFKVIPVYHGNPNGSNNFIFLNIDWITSYFPTKEMANSYLEMQQFGLHTQQRLATNNRFRKQNSPFGISQQSHLLREQVKLFHYISVLPLICFDICPQLLTHYILQALSKIIKSDSNII